MLALAIGRLGTPSTLRKSLLKPQTPRNVVRHFLSDGLSKLPKPKNIVVPYPKGRSIWKSYSKYSKNSLDNGNYA